MKRMLVVLVAVLSLAVAVPAMANGGGDKITLKDNNVLLGKHNTGIQGNKNHHNTVVGGDYTEGTTVNGGIKNVAKGGNATVGDVSNDSINRNKNTNTNTNTNRNVNRNTNTNDNTNIQGQLQGQAQGQIQGQGQGQAQSVDIKFEADKRELLGLGSTPTADAKLNDTKASEVRARGSLLDRVKFLTISMAKRASKNASDMQVEPALLFENDFQLDRIIVGEGEEFGGYIYVFADGSDCYLAAMDAEASEVAMKAGMTHIIRLGEVEVSKVLAGSAWNIGFGGGASIMTSGEDIGIAPNGGFGYGKAKSSSQFRPDAVYEVSYSADLIREK